MKILNNVGREDNVKVVMLDKNGLMVKPLFVAQRSLPGCTTQICEDDDFGSVVTHEQYEGDELSVLNFFGKDKSDPTWACLHVHDDEVLPSLVKPHIQFSTLLQKALESYEATDTFMDVAEYLWQSVVTFAKFNSSGVNEDQLSQLAERICAAIDIDQLTELDDDSTVILENLPKLNFNQDVSKTITNKFISIIDNKLVGFYLQQGSVNVQTVPGLTYQADLVRSGTTCDVNGFEDGARFISIAVILPNNEDTPAAVSHQVYTISNKES